MRWPEPEPGTPLRRVGVLGDVHAEDRTVEAALAFFATQSLDAVLCVGDIVDGDGDAERTCALLVDHGVVCVRGNHDRWFTQGGPSLPDATPAEALSARSRAFLAALPATRGFATESGPLLLCHGLGARDMARLLPDDEGYALSSNFDLWAVHAAHNTAWMIGGHTHRRLARAFDHLTVLNAGTLHRKHRPCVLLVDFSVPEARFYDVGAAHELSPAEHFSFDTGA